MMKYLSYAGTHPNAPINTFVISVSDSLFFRAFFFNVQPDGIVVFSYVRIEFPQHALRFPISVLIAIDASQSIVFWLENFFHNWNMNTIILLEKE